WSRNVAQEYEVVTDEKTPMIAKRPSGARNGFRNDGKYLAGDAPAVGVEREQSAWKNGLDLQGRLDAGDAADAHDFGHAAEGDLAGQFDKVRPFAEVAAQADLAA